MSLNQIAKLLMEAEKKKAFEKGLFVGLGISTIINFLIFIILFCLT